MHVSRSRAWMCALSVVSLACGNPGRNANTSSSKRADAGEVTASASDAASDASRATGATSSTDDAGHDAGAPRRTVAKLDAGHDAGPDLTEPCVWSPLRCSPSTSGGCRCERACEGHAYAMSCASDGSCSCTEDGTPSGSATATCGDAFSETTSFVSACAFPGDAYTHRDGGVTDCSSAPPQSAFIATGCFYSKSCGGHAYAVRCPSGHPCFCATDGVFTATAAANCSDGNSLGAQYASACMYP